MVLDAPAVDDAFYIKGGAMLWPDTWPVGLEFTASWQEHDFKRSFINHINDEIDNSPPPSSTGDIDGGDVEIWSIETNVVWGPKTGGMVGFYVTGGIGIDFLEAKITTTGLVYYPPVGGIYWCVPGGAGPGTIIKGRETTEEFSYNAGIGIDFELSSGTTLYLEASYHSADTDRASTDFIPIVFGVRF